MKKSLLKLLTCACGFALFASVSTVATAESIVFSNDTVKAGWTFNKNATTIETPTQLEAKKHAVVSAKADVSAFKLNGTRTTAIADGSRPTFTRLQVKDGSDPVVTWTITPTEGLSFTPTFIKMTIYCDNTDERQDAVVVKAGSTVLGTYTPLRNGKTLENDALAGTANLASFVVIALSDDQKTALTTAGAFNLTATMNIPAGKDGGFTDIQVIGVVNGALEVPAITIEQTEALDQAKAAGNAIKDEYMNAAAKAELNKQLAAAGEVDGLDIDAVTAALNAAVTAAQASIDAYKPFVAAVTEAEATLAAASADADGYATFQSAVNTARNALDNGTPTDPTSNIKTLAIAKNAFVVAGASPEAPKDATSFIQNPTFADTLGWTITNPNPGNVTVSLEAAGTLGFTTSYFKAVDNVVTNGRGLFKNFAVEQTIENIPNGDYYLSADVYFEENANFGRDYLYLYAGEKSAQCKRASADGPATTKVKVRVSGNSLTIKLASTADRNNIIAFSNFKLEYVNFESWAATTVDSVANTVVVTVNSAEAFADVFVANYPDSADVTINLNAGTYDLGTNGSQRMPTHKGNLAFVGNGNVTIKGGFRSSNGIMVHDYRFENLNFVSQDNAGTESSPFYFNSGGDDVTGQMIVRNCTFTDLKACVVRGKNGHVHNYVFENNTFDGLGHHFFQLQNSHQREGFFFTENVVKNFNATGGQFFNIQLPENPAAYTDSTFTMVVENNLFYKIGGQAASARNFIESNKANKYKEVTFNINNNIFWELYKDTLFRNTNLALFTADSTQKVEFNILNNLIYPDDMMTNIWDADLGDGEIKNFPVTEGNIVINQKDLYVASLAPGFEYIPGELILKSSPLYTASTTGSYIGLKNMYYEFDVEAEDHFIVDNLTALKQALTYKGAGDDVLIEVKNNIDPEGYYNMGTSTNRLSAKKTLTVKAFNGNAPKINGALISSGSAKLDKILVEGITFTGATAETAAPFCTQGNDTISAIIFRNNTFKEMGAPLVRLRSGSYVDTLAFENNVIQDLLGNNHVFICNNGNQILKNFSLIENKIINYGGKQFMQFANVKNSADSTLNINVKNNLFYNFKSGDGSNAKNFIEGAKTAYLNINVNNNFFYYDSIPATWSIPLQVNPGGTYKAYNLKLEGNVYNNWDGVLVDMKDIYTVDTDPAIVMDDIQYAYGDKFFTNSPLYTAGVEGAYVGTSDMYYPFKAEGEGEDLILTVYNDQELYDALAANFSGLTNVTIELAADSFSLGERQGRPMPKFGGNVTVKAADKFSPKVGGSFRSNGGMKVNNYVFDGLHFVAATSGANTDSSPIYIHKGQRDSITGTLEIKNCTFTEMPACIIRINANNSENYVHAVNVHNNTFDGINHHFFQFAGGKDFGVTSFNFTENVVKNYKSVSAQFFNTPIPVNPSALSDSIYTMNVEHNTFYKIGGMATQMRHFIECNKDNNYKKVTMNFNNNIFWENYSLDGALNCDLALFNAKEGQEVEVNVLNNLLYPETVMTNMFDPDYVEGTVANFPVVSGNITPNVKHLYLADLAADTLTFWASEEMLKIFDNTAAYTAGIDGTYLGAKACYTKGVDIPEGAKYFWASPEGLVIEMGGQAVANAAAAGRVNYAQASYYTISLNGKKNFDEGNQFVTITLDEEIAAGDTIAITGFRNKNADAKKAAAWFRAGTATFDDGTDGLKYTNINNEGGVDFDNDGETPNTITVVVPEGASGKTLDMTRAQTGTNLFITQLVIMPYIAPVTPPDAIVNGKVLNKVYTNNGTLFMNMNEASNVKVYDVLGKTVKNFNAKAGLNTVEGLNAGQIYIIRTESEVVKIAL